MRDGGREGGPQEEVALVDTLAKTIHRVDDMKGEGGREGGEGGRGRKREREGREGGRGGREGEGREGGREDRRRRWL